MYFSEADYEKTGALVFLAVVGGGGHVMIVIKLSIFFNCDTLIFKLHQKNAATLTKGGFLLADSKLEVCQE